MPELVLSNYLDFTFDNSEVNLTIRSRYSNNNNSVVFSFELPSTVTADQIRMGDKITDEILRNPNLLEEIKKGLVEIENGDFIEWISKKPNHHTK